MVFALKILQLSSAVVLVLLILTQDRGSGLSAAFGGTGGFYATKRGAERVLAIATFVTAILFLVFSFAASILNGTI